jgi:hypothetical protein
VRLVGLFDKEAGGLVFELGNVRRLTSDKATPAPAPCMFCGRNAFRKAG